VAKLILPTTVDELRSSVSPSLLKNIDYRRRRIVMNEGQLEPERHMLEGNCGAILRELQIIERASWQGMKGAPKFVGVAQERFWRAIAQAQPVAARPVAWLLRCAGRPIAYQVHIETRDIIYKIGSCYDLEWKAYSPGSLLTYEIFSDACRRGKRHIDWGRGDSGYKSTWGANCEDDYLEEALLFRPGMLGRTALRLAQRALPDWTLASDC
jgi:Protein involved in cellulose biosynthesis (CelD)